MKFNIHGPMGPEVMDGKVPLGSCSVVNVAPLEPAYLLQDRIAHGKNDSET